MCVGAWWRLQFAEAMCDAGSAPVEVDATSTSSIDNPLPAFEVVVRTHCIRKLVDRWRLQPLPQLPRGAQLHSSIPCLARLSGSNLESPRPGFSSSYTNTNRACMRLSLRWEGVLPPPQLSGEAQQGGPQGQPMQLARITQHQQGAEPPQP